MSSCKFCQYILEFAQDGFDDPAKAHEWFHGECSSSSCASQRSPAQNICSYCHHLRLPHLMLCLLNTGKILQWYPAGITIPFLPLEKMLQEPCDLCRMISNGLSEEIERVVSGNSHSPFVSPRAHLLLPDHTNTEPGSRFKPNVRDREACIQVRGTNGRRSVTTSILFNQLGDNPSCTSHSRRLHLCQPMANVRTFYSTQLQPTIDWDRIRRLVVSCSLGHSRCRKRQTHCLPAGFRVIDVHKRCVREAGSACHFVALSYVWGDTPDYTKFTATRSSIHILKQEGALVDWRTPRTINDAMQACIELGERFLWADRLCIIQDDENDKENQINSMDTIFRSATFTIAAIDGTVDDGIPGISAPRTPQHNGCTIDDLEVMATYNPPVIASLYSPWSKRGWTLQESLLSSRMLYFTQTLAYFRCLRNDRFEDIRIEAPWRSFRDRLIPSRSESIYRCWGMHLQDYRTRSLSDPKDVFNAFAGIANNLFPCPDKPLYGLPRTEFDQTLLWSLDRLTVFMPCPQLCYWDCPSWSWGYTRNFPEHRIVLSPFRWVETLVRWGFVDAGGQLSTFQYARTSYKPETSIHGEAVTSSSESDSDSAHDSESSEKSRESAILSTKPEEWIYSIIAIAWKSGCISTSYPSNASTDVPFCKMSKDLKILLGDLEALSQIWLDQLPSPLSHLEEESLREGLQKLLKPGVLIGSVQSAFFKVVRPAKWNRYWHSEPLHIHDRSGRIVGDLGKYYDPMADAEILSSMRGDESTVELIGLSLSCISGRALTGYKYNYLHSILDYLCGISYWEQYENPQRFTMKRYLEILSDRDRDLTFFDSEGNYMPLLPIVNVMVIGWSGPYAHRITIGWVLLTSWIKAEREIKTILLE